jgi:hypothetical protein
VIARRGGSVEEILGAPGVGAVCDSQDEVVAAVAARSGFSRTACRDRVEQEFSHAAMSARHLAFYDRIARGPTG